MTDYRITTPTGSPLSPPLDFVAALDALRRLTPPVGAVWLTRTSDGVVVKVGTLEFGPAAGRHLRAAERHNAGILGKRGPIELAELRAPRKSVCCCGLSKWRELPSGDLRCACGVIARRNRHGFSERIQVLRCRWCKRPATTRVRVGWKFAPACAGDAAAKGAA
jgi:hypothetical protein